MKKNHKFLLNVKKSSFMLSMHRVSMRLVCIHIAYKNFVISKPNVTSYIIFS